MNLVSIRLLRSIGIPYAREYTARFGIDMSRFSSTLTMALGSGGVTPLEIIGAYGVLANGGYKVKPYFIQTITDRNGNTIYEAPTPELCDLCYQDYLPELANNEDTTKDEASTEDSKTTETEIADSATETTEMEQAISYDAPRVMSHANALALKRDDLAGKTGTTNDYVDAWFTGFNPQVATTVWVGFDNPSTLGRGEAGGVAALPIWVDYMKTALEGVQTNDNELPEYIEDGFVNASTGIKTDEQDPQSTQEFFIIPELVPENRLFGSQIQQQSQLSEKDLALLNAEPDQEGLDTLDSGEITQQEGDINGSIEFPANTQRIIEDTQDTEGLF